MRIIIYLEENSMLNILNIFFSLLGLYSLGKDNFFQTIQNNSHPKSWVLLNIFVVVSGMSQSFEYFASLSDTDKVSYIKR